MNKANKIIIGTGKILGTVIEYKIKVTGYVIGTIAEMSDNKKLGKNSKKISKNLGKDLGKSTKNAAKITGKIVDKILDVSIDSAKFINKKATKTETKIYGNANEFFKGKYINAKYKVLNKD